MKGTRAAKNIRYNSGSVRQTSYVEGNTVRKVQPARVPARRMHFGNEMYKNISSSIGWTACGYNLVGSKKQP